MTWPYIPDLPRLARTRRNLDGVYLVAAMVGATSGCYLVGLTRAHADAVAAACGSTARVVVPVWSLAGFAVAVKPIPAEDTVECECCGMEHRAGWTGDCRDDGERLVMVDDGHDDFMPAGVYDLAVV